MQRTSWMLALALVAACGEPTRTDAVLELTGDPANGEVVYGAGGVNCALCHGAAGEGVTDLGKALASTTRSAEEIIDIVINGTTGTSGTVMAPLGAALPDDQDIADVTAFVLTL